MANDGFKQGQESQELGNQPLRTPSALPIRNEIAFQEFIDALVILVLYKDPNPFVPFLVRFNRFLVDSLLTPLRDHWENTFSGGGLCKILRNGLDRERIP